MKTSAKQKNKLYKTIRNLKRKLNETLQNNSIMILLRLDVTYIFIKLIENNIGFFLKKTANALNH